MAYAQDQDPDVIDPRSAAVLRAAQQARMQAQAANREGGGAGVSAAVNAVPNALTSALARSQAQQQSIDRMAAPGQLATLPSTMQPSPGNNTISPDAMAAIQRANAANGGFSGGGAGGGGGGSWGGSSGAYVPGGASAFVGPQARAAMPSPTPTSQIPTTQPTSVQPTSSVQPTGSLAVAPRPITSIPTSGSPAAPGAPNASPTTTPPPGEGTPTGTPSPVNAPPSTGLQNQSSTPQGGGGLADLTNNVMKQLQDLQSGLAAPGTSPDAQAVYMKQAQGILAMLDQQEAQMRAENEKAGTSIDPATQFTLDKLRETLTENMKTTREDLNRRGLSESGILLELENRLQKGSASDQAQILASRLSKLQDELSAGLSQIRTQKYSTASQFGLAGANAQRSQDELSQNLRQKREEEALQGMLNLRGQQSQEQRDAERLAYERQNAQAQRDWQAQQDQLTRDWNATQNKTYKLTADQQLAQDNAARARAASGGGGSGGGPAYSGAPATGPGSKGSAASDVMNFMLNNYHDSQSANAYLDRGWAQLQALGLSAQDIAGIRQAANSLPSGGTGPVGNANPGNTSGSRGGRAVL